MFKLDKLQALNQAYITSTSGKWIETDGTIYGDDNTYLVCDVVGNSYNAINEQDEYNCKYIALAHEAMPDLLEAVRALEWLTDAMIDEGAGNIEGALHLARAVLAKFSQGK